LTDTNANRPVRRKAVKTSRHRGVKIAAFIGAPLVTLGLIGGALALSLPAANAAAVIYDNGGGGSDSQVSTMVGADGKFAYCIMPGSPDPTTTGSFIPNATSFTIPGNQYGGPVTPTPLQLAQINYVTTTYGQIDGNDMNAQAQRAAVSVVVKNIVSPQWEYNTIAANSGYTGAVGDVAAQTTWLDYPAGAAQANLAGSLAAQYWAELGNVSVGSAGVDGDPGSLSGSFSTDPTDHYVGTFVLNTTGDTDGTWTVALTNGVFESTGASTGTFAANGSASLTENVIGVPPSPGSPYRAGASYTYAVPGKAGAAGWAPAVGLTTDTAPGAQWVTSGTGQQTSTGQPKSASGAISDPGPRSSVFSPQVETKSAANYYVSGDTPKDTITLKLGKNADGSVNEWPKNSTGVYAPIPVNGTLYGPLATVPKQSSTVPAGTPVAGHGTITVGGTTTDPLTQNPVITSDTKIAGDQGAASGYYVWVEDIEGSDVKTAVQPWLDGGSAYSYHTDFAISVESFVSPPKVTTNASTSTGVKIKVGDASIPETGLGLPVTDKITVSGKVIPTAGMYIVDRYYTFEQSPVADGAGNLIAPTAPVCDATTLDYTSGHIAVTKPGTLTASFHSDKLGVGTWVESLYSADGTLLTKGDCANKDEWAAVKQLVVTTQAKSNGGGEASDTATLWGTVPAGSQLSSTLYDQKGSTASTSDEAIATAGPVGLNEGLVNGVVVTLPSVKYPDSMTKGYFVESVFDIDGNLVAQGDRGVSSETIVNVPTPPVSPSTGSGGNGSGAGGNDSVAALPIISG